MGSPGSEAATYADACERSSGWGLRRVRPRRRAFREHEVHDEQLREQGERPWEEFVRGVRNFRGRYPIATLGVLNLADAAVGTDPVYSRLISMLRKLRSSIAAVLTVFAALVFFTNLLPGTIAGFAAGSLALYAAVAAFLILLLGVFVKGV